MKTLFFEKVAQGPNRELSKNRLHGQNRGVLNFYEKFRGKTPPKKSFAILFFGAPGTLSHTTALTSVQRDECRVGQKNTEQKNTGQKRWNTLDRNGQGLREMGGGCAGEG